MPRLARIDIGEYGASDILTYVSPSGLRKINFRKFASSDQEIIDAGFIPEGTFDVMEKIGNQFKKVDEIKFISK